MRKATFQGIGVAAACMVAIHLPAADCNLNGVDDAQDIRDGRSRDCNQNALPDECDLSNPDVVLGSPLLFSYLEESGRIHIADLEPDGKAEVLLVGGGGLGLIERLGLRADGTFEKRPVVTIPTRPRLLAPADLDQDGDTDLVAATDQPGMATALQAADGVHSPASALATSDFAFDIATGDLDGDGFSDAASLGTTGNLHVFLGDGQGALRLLSPPVRFPGLESSGGRVAPRDMDGDGDLDLAAAGGAPSRAALFLNDGQAAFTLADIPALRSADGVNAVAPGDFNGDGSADIAATGFAQGLGIVVFTNLLPGDPAFSSQRHALPWDQVSLAAADLNGDGRDDLLGAAVHTSGGCPRQDGQGWILLSQGEGFAPLTSVRALAHGTQGIVAGDLDGDGLADLAARAVDGSIITVPVHRGTREEDCNLSGVPDSCELREDDCDFNGKLDACEIGAGAADCDRNGIPDACDPDCDQNGIPDACDLAAGTHPDCNRNALPDLCERGADADRNGVPDDCDLGPGQQPDCNLNGAPDTADLLPALRLPLPAALDIVPPLIPANALAGFSFNVRLCAADLNGDGRQDLAAARGVVCCPLLPGSVHASLAVHGSATPAFEVTRIENPLDLAAADFDLDGAAELVVLDRAFTWCPQDAAVWLLPNRGDGSFRRRRALPVPGGAAQAIADDFNGDGAPDLALLTGLDVGLATLRVLAGDGRGALAPLDGPAPALEGPTEGVSADLDQDGDRDLLFGSSTGMLQLLRGSGTGSFAAPVPLPEPQVYGAPLAIDVEGDGDLDVVVMGCDPSNCGPRLLRNEGSGTFRKGEVLVPQTAMQLGVVDDFDADGDDDIATAGFRTTGLSLNNDSALTLLVNRRGVLEAAPEIALGAPIATDIASLQLGGDGRPDLALAFDSRSAIAVLDDLESAALGQPQALLARPSGASALAIGDLDRDGRADAITTYQFDRNILVWRGSGDGFLSPPDVLAVGESSFGAASGDLDGDGGDDVAYADATGIQVLRIQPGLAPQPAPHVALGAAAFQIEAADLDLDGDLDLAALTATRLATVLQVDRGVFARGPGVPVPASPASMALGDWNADGRLDVATLGNNPVLADTVALYGGGEGGQLSPRGTAAVPLLGNSIRAGDFDADGDLDLGIAHDQLEGFSLLESTGDLRFARRAADGPGPWLGHAVLPDLDGDGTADLAVAGRETFEILVGQGDGTFRLERSLPVDGFQGSSLVPTDLDRDGRLDLVAAIRDDDADLLLVLWNGSEPRSYDHDRDGVPDECGPSGAARFRRGDVDQDGAWNLTDAIAVLDHLFLTARPLDCGDAADANDDGELNISDPVALLGYLFLGSRAPPRPFASCGFDATADKLPCQTFRECP